MVGVPWNTVRGNMRRQRVRVHGCPIVNRGGGSNGRNPACHPADAAGVRAVRVPWWIGVRAIPVLLWIARALCCDMNGTLKLLELALIQAPVRNNI